MVLGTEVREPEEVAWRLVTASWITHALRAAAVLGIPDLLADGSRSVGDLATATETDAPALARLLRTLTALGVCAETDQGTIQLTPVGAFLRADVVGSAQPFALGIMAPFIEQAWHALPEAIRTGHAVFPEVHGEPFWDYLSTHPEDGARFDASMNRGNALSELLLTTCDLSRLGTLVDVGGGQGRLLAAALTTHPHLRGILVDRPGVLPGAEPVLAAAGVRERCDLVACDILEAVPAGGDAYVLASIIHDWPDEPALAILRACHRAMAPGAKIWLLENVLAPGATDAWTHLLDLLMLTLFGAKERTAAEHAALLKAAGFTDVVVLPGEPPWSIVEAVRAEGRRS